MAKTWARAGEGEILHGLVTIHERKKLFLQNF